MTHGASAARCLLGPIGPGLVRPPVGAGARTRLRAAFGFRDLHVQRSLQSRFDRAPRRPAIAKPIRSDEETRLELAIPADEFIDRYGVAAQDNLTLLVMGQPNHGGSG